MVSGNAGELFRDRQHGGPISRCIVGESDVAGCNYVAYTFTRVNASLGEGAICHRSVQQT